MPLTPFLSQSTSGSSASADVAPALLARLRGHTPAMRGLLEQLVRAESPSRAIEAHREAYVVLARELEAIEYRVRAVRGRGVGDHLYARPERRVRTAPYQLLVGHLDTVWPVGTVETMPVRLDDGELRGPGVVDMKGGLAQMVYALRALDELGLEPALTPVVHVASDEEVGSFDSERQLVRLARGAARAFVLEPAFGPSGKLKIARKGAGHFRVTAKGRASHAGVAPEEGLSAILELSHQIQRLFALNDPARGVTVNVGTIDGGLRANVVAPEATADVDVRVPTLDEAVEVEAAIRGLQPVEPGAVLEIDGGFGRAPMEPTTRNLELFARARVCGELLGLPLEATSVGGSSDGNIASLYTATLDGLGSVGDGAHALDERVVVEQMPERAALLALLLLAPAEEAT
jgi:glutamate carboxypeptidase